MASDGLPAERLRDYLGQLKPEARALLIAELERGLLRGDDIPGTDLVLQELRRTLRDLQQPPPRIGNPARLFFKPLEPFLVDDGFGHSHPGRIARAALEPLWSWTSRDLMPAEAATFSEEASRALLAQDRNKAELLAHSIQNLAIQRIEAALAAIEGNDKARRRLGAQIGVPGALEVAGEVLRIFKARDDLAALGRQLPGHFDALADAKLLGVKALLDARIGQTPDIFLHALVLVMSRLAAPWQLVRLATRAAESDKAVRIAATPYAAAVSIVLAEVERLVGELTADLRSGRGVAVVALLKAIHDAARGLRTELDLSVDTAWGRQLAAIRTDISNLLKSEIESMPGRVRRLLRPRPLKEIPPGAALDLGDVAEVEALIGFVDACRKYASELALNEMTQRAYSELQQYLETGTPTLIDSLRNATGEANRRFRESQVEAAVRFCAKVFGPDYAAQLARAAEVAAAANSEPRTAAGA
jgi:hypothetical protein